MEGELTIFDEPHHHTLELMAARALANGDAATAFALADRRCRTRPAPSSYCYVLRAEASHRMGEVAEAVADLELALEISPEDIVVTRRLLAWAAGERQRMAAAAILASDRDIGALRGALTVLRRDGRRAFAALAVLDDAIKGWAAWSRNAPVELLIASQGDSLTIALAPDPHHPLASRDLCAVEIDVARPRSRHPQSISLRLGTETFFATRAQPNATPPPPPPCSRDSAAPHAAPDGAPLGAPLGVTVIVPVYGDYAATKACLDSLLKALRGEARARVLIVDDASPDERIRRHLARLGRTAAVEVLTNEVNTGFVGAVNRALGCVEDDDVVLLNSDTIVPPGFLERLAAAAYSSPDIGTVTPLSNNGEFMSFPVANASNPVGSATEIEAINRVAAEVNRGRIVDLPSGIGFCLYVTRRCLDGAGGLSERFHRGYLEDTDFCLRARDLGWRNVCATDVFVGHAGSRSFRHEKKSLVSRNFKVLEQSFPRYPVECIAFRDADPLRPARAAIERAMPQRPGHVLLVTGSGALAAVAGERARHLTAQRREVLICYIRHRPAGLAGGLSDPNGDVPQSIEFDLSSADGRERLAAFVRQARPSRIEFVDPAGIPDEVARALCGLGIPYDAWIADAGLPGPGPDAAALAARLRRGDRPFAQPGRRNDAAQAAPTQSASTLIMDGAGRILAPCAQAEAFARRFLSAQNIGKLERVARPGRATRIRPLDGADRLGIVPVRTSALELRYLREIARVMRDAHPQIAIAVLGETLDDLMLMRFGNVFVSGPVPPADLKRLIRQYRLNAVLAGFGAPLFGHPMVETVMHCGLPVAYFDWSLGDCKPSAKDLAIDPSVSPHDAAIALGRWAARR